LVIQPKANEKFNTLGGIGCYDTTACADAHGLAETNNVISILGDITGLVE
jgi:hypothetical protein